MIISERDKTSLIIYMSLVWNVIKRDKPSLSHNPIEISAAFPLFVDIPQPAYGNRKTLPKCASPKPNISTTISPAFNQIILLCLIIVNV